MTFEILIGCPLFKLLGTRQCGTDPSSDFVDSPILRISPPPGRAAARPYRANPRLGIVGVVRRFGLQARSSGREPLLRVRGMSSGARIGGGRWAWPAPGRAAARPYRANPRLGIVGVVRRFGLQARSSGREPLLRVRGMSSGARIGRRPLGLAGARTRGSASLPGESEIGHCGSRSEIRFAGSKFR